MAEVGVKYPEAYYTNMALASKIVKPGTSQWYTTILAGTKTGRRSRRGPTVNVVSPNLCGVCSLLSMLRPCPYLNPPLFLAAATADLSLVVEDILQRLSPSLKQHEHCDIIDINPGIGLWSSKLHEYLKPRSHILVEPHEKYYRPFLEPLLSQPDSKYRMADIEGLTLESYEAILGRDLLSHQKSMSPPGSGSTKNSLLLIANLAHPLRIAHQLSISPAQKWVHRFLRMIRDRSGFHASGLVRLLVWVLDEDKSAILPRSVANRLKLAVESEVCSVTEEIAGADAAAGFDRRLLNLDMKSAKRVAQAMQDRNVKIPAGRQAVLHKMVTNPARQDVSDPAEANESGEVSHYGFREWHHELEALRKDFKEGVFTEFVDQSPPRTDGRKSLAKPIDTNKVHKKNPPKRPKTPQWTRMNLLTNTIISQRKKDKTAESIANELVELYARQEALKDLELSEGERSLKMKELNDMSAQLQQKVESGVKGFAKRVAFYADDRQATEQNPPLLQWDRRSAEPLVVHEDEFYPRLPLALLDVQPRPVDTTPNFDLLLTSIFKTPTRPIGRTLDSLAPGAADALIPEIRGLRSRINPGDLRPRVLTTEMIDDLSKAWEMWPYRPNSAKLWSTAGDATKEELELEFGRNV